MRRWSPKDWEPGKRVGRPTAGKAFPVKNAKTNQIIACVAVFSVRFLLPGDSERTEKTATQANQITDVYSERGKINSDLFIAKGVVVTSNAYFSQAKGQ